MDAFSAALKGAKEIGSTVVTMSVSLVAVFIPLLLMGGIVGRLLREFAVTLSVAIAVSMVISLTATPMMCAHLLRGHESHGWLYLKIEDLFDRLVGLYGKALAVVLRHSFVTLLVLVTTIGLNVYLFTHVSMGFFPQQDTGRLVGQILADQDTSFQSMDKILLQMVNIVGADPAADSAIGFTGGSGGGGGAATLNQGRIFVSLKPLNERKITVDYIMQRLRPKLARVPGATLYLQAAQDLRVGGRNSAALYQFTMRGDNLQDLIVWAPRMFQQLKSIPIIVDVNSDQQNRGLQSMVTYDRETAARFGISPQLIDNTLYDAFGQRQVSTMYKSLNQYHVVMEAAPQYWQNPQTLQQIYIHAPNGQQVPLSAIAHYAPAVAPLGVNHQGLFPSVTISFNLQPGVALGDAEVVVLEAARKIGLPATVQTMFTGTAAAFQDSTSSEPYLIAAALMAVYLMLGILYESYIHPITILSTLPSAGVGALLALMLTHTDLSIISMIGIILLIGLVKKNGILIVDFALAAEREEHKSPRDAIFEASLLRFRPILMTTFAAMLGALPLALGTGMGSELRRPLGITIIGGLAMSQVLTLFTTPVVYLYFDRLQHWWERVRGVKPRPLAPIESEG
jgi:multidrug efflux pump